MRLLSISYAVFCLKKKTEPYLDQIALSMDIKSLTLSINFNPAARCITIMDRKSDRAAVETQHSMVGRFPVYFVRHEFRQAPEVHTSVNICPEPDVVFSRSSEATIRAAGGIS